MKHLIWILLLLVSCDYVTKEDCLKSCDKMCDSKIEGMKKVDLKLGCEAGCRNSVVPCAQVGVVSGWQKNETVTYCIHIFRTCMTACEEQEKDDGQEEGEQEESKDLQHLWSPGTTHQGGTGI